MLKTSPMTKISAAVAIPLIAGTVALFWLASLMHIDAHLAPAGPTVERQYTGNADLYQLKATCNGTMPPYGLLTNGFLPVVDTRRSSLCL